MTWGSDYEESLSDDEASVVTVVSEPPQPIKYRVKVSDNVELQLARTSRGGWMQTTTRSLYPVASYEYLLPSLRRERQAAFASAQRARRALKHDIEVASKGLEKLEDERIAIQAQHAHPSCNLSFRIKSSIESKLQTRCNALAQKLLEANLKLDVLQQEQDTKKRGKRLMSIEEPLEWLRNEWPCVDIVQVEYEDGELSDFFPENTEHATLPAKHILQVS